MKKIGKIIQRERQLKGLTYTDLSIKTGISRMTLVRLERGETPIYLESVINIFKALNLDFYNVIEAYNEA